MRIALGQINPIVGDIPGNAGNKRRSMLFAISEICIIISGRVIKHHKPVPFRVYTLTHKRINTFRRFAVARHHFIAEINDGQRAMRAGPKGRRSTAEARREKSDYSLQQLEVKPRKPFAFG